jgi:spore coat protein U-like protein
MTGPVSAQLSYGLYTDSAGSNNWNDIGGSGIPATTGNGSAQPLPVYGKIPAGQYLAPGLYSDTVTATVSY